MKILVTGAGGQLGHETVLMLNAAGEEVVGISRKELDFSRPEDVADSIAAYRADWVAVIMNSMRQGWGLKGFEKYAAKRGGVTRGTPITEDGIQHTLTRLRRNGRT